MQSIAHVRVAAVQRYDALPNGGARLDRVRLACVGLLHRRHQRHPRDLRRHAR